MDCNIFIGTIDENKNIKGDFMLHNRDIVKGFIRTFATNNKDVVKTIDSIRRGMMLPIEAELTPLEKSEAELIGGYILYNEEKDTLHFYEEDVFTGMSVVGKHQVFWPSQLAYMETDKEFLDFYTESEPGGPVDEMLKLFIEKVELYNVDDADTIKESIKDETFLDTYVEIDDEVIQCENNVDSFVDAISGSYAGSDNDVCLGEFLDCVKVHGLSITETVVVYSRLYSQIEGDTIMRLEVGDDGAVSHLIE